MTERVAITGVGVVAPGAIGYADFCRLLEQGRSSLAHDASLDGPRLRSRTAGRVTDFTPKDFIRPAKLRRLNQLSRFGLSAASLAIDNSGLSTEDLDRGTTGVAIGTAFGPVDTSVRYLEDYIEKGPSLAPPQLFAESVANAPGSHVAIEWNLRGFNVTFTQREASSLTAATYAGLQIVSGNVDRALVGGVEEINDVLYGVLDEMGALARPRDGGGEAMRPLDRDRDGLLPGEGGAVLVMEREPSRAALCSLSGFASGRDSSAPLSDWGTGAEAVSAVMMQAISDAGLNVSDIDAVWSSANGSLRGDLLEARALESTFGSDTPVVATKGFFGEYAAGGAIHLASAVAGIDRQMLWGSPGHQNLPDDTSLSVNRSATPCRLDHVLVNALAAGGGIVSAVLSKDHR